MPPFRSEEAELVRAGLEALGKRDLVLAVHDASLPGDPRWDSGRGTPYSAEALRFFEWAAELGFNGVQLGPQGMMEPGSASPYEAALFSRNLLNLDVEQLVADRFLRPAEAKDELEGRPEAALSRADHRFAWGALTALVDRVAADPDPATRRAADGFAENNQPWLEPDALYELIGAERQERWYRRWSGPGAELDRRLFAPRDGELQAADERRAELRARPGYRRYALVQWQLREQHERLRTALRGLRLKTFGDFQVGLSARDTWARQALLLPGYLLGAPPSRTNPDGQPWGYPVLDPAQLGTPARPGPALAFLGARVELMLDTVEGIRLDHPHGLICPWVYRDEQPDPLASVQQGARLFSSPDLADHPALARFAIARPDQLDRARPRHADEWVTSLTDEQVARYAVAVDAIVAKVRASGQDASAIVCEVLSTLPYPVKRVLERHGLGRFRVTQKASLTDRADVYRPEHARPQDWIMLGNHDTPPIWSVVRSWRERGQAEARALDVAERLEREPARRQALVARLAVSDEALVQAMLADALASPALHVSIFFTDLLGHTEPYNVPGTVDERNWSPRITRSDLAAYRGRRARLGALNLPRALATALRARGEPPHQPLAGRLAALGGGADLEEPRTLH